MKILIVQDRLRNGGTERQSVLLANSFSAAGHTTTLLTFRPGGPLATTVNPAVPLHSLQRRDYGLDWFAPGLRSNASRFAPDIVLAMGRMANCHAGSLQRSFGRAGRRIAVIATMRTGKSLPWLFRRSLRQVRHVVANSREAGDNLRHHYGVSPDKITVVHNSLVFPPESSVSRNDALRQAQGANASTHVMLCVAMFRPEKNQRELIEIVAGLPASLDWQLWLAGEGTTRPGCERLVAQKGLNQRVKFLGFQRDPSPLYAAADVAVHASGSESLSNFLIEAQAHGLPAVAYAAQGISESFLPEATGWVIMREDRAAFRSVIERLAAAPGNERAARSAAARDYARTAFDPARQVAAYLDLFTRLLARA